jgi:hypothetical protein
VHWWPKATRRCSRPGHIDPRKLFDLPIALYNLDQFVPDYDVAADGRFPAIRRDPRAADEIHVVLNWTQELGRALGR